MTHAIYFWRAHHGHLRRWRHSGCFEPFLCLLSASGFNPDKDRLWSVGDLVNRGPQNLEVLRWFMITAITSPWYWVATITCWPALLARANPAEDNIDDILEAPDQEKLIEWMHFQPLAHSENGITMVHAGIPPMWTVQDTLDRAWEVENALQGARCKDFKRDVWKRPYCMG